MNVSGFWKKVGERHKQVCDGETGCHQTNYRTRGECSESKERSN